MKKTILFLIIGFFAVLVRGQELPVLKISDNQKFIVTQDNEPFFWLGGTAWELIHRLTEEEINLYLTNRAKKGFTVIQTVILAELDGLNTPNAYGYQPLINNDPTKINEKYFKLVDYVIDKAGGLGMYIGLLPTWGDKYHKADGVGPEIFTPENATLFGELLAKRYASKTNIIWILGGDRWPENDEDRAIINNMAQGIRNYDNLHLITLHPSAPNLASNFFNEEWLDIDLFQTGHDRTQFDFENVWKGANVVPLRPVVNGEPRYEDIPDRFNPRLYGWMDDTDVRSAAYWTMLAGGAGYTYGCHDIWQMFSPGKEPNNGPRRYWKEALNLPGSGQLIFLKSLLQSFSWQKMVNDQTLILNENKKDSAFIVAARSIRNDCLLIYTPMGKPITPDLSKTDAKKVVACWFNPRDGRSKKIGTFNVSDQREFKPGSVGRGRDFVLIIMDKKARYKIPGLKN